MYVLHSFYAFHPSMPFYPFAYVTFSNPTPITLKITAGEQCKQTSVVVIISVLVDQMEGHLWILEPMPFGKFIPEEIPARGCSRWWPGTKMWMLNRFFLSPHTDEDNIHSDFGIILAILIWSLIQSKWVAAHLATHSSHVSDQSYLYEKYSL